jgi:hypothetical protein
LQLSPRGFKIVVFRVITRIAVRLALLLLIGSMIAALPSIGFSQTTAGPTTAPSAEDITATISKLGDADFRVRRDASHRLREIGAPALPALKRAAEDKNPEVRSRATQIVRSLEYRHVPGRPLHQNRSRTRSVNMRIINGQRAIDVNDEGRQIKIIQGGDGIDMTVTGETDGKPATQKYKAATPEQLQADNPEAFALYQRWSRGMGNEIDGIGMQGNVIIQGQGNVMILPPLQPVPFIRGPGDDLAGLKARLDDEMHKAKLSPEQQKRVQDSLDKVEESHGLTGGGDLDQTDQRITEYDKACDDLRKTLSDLKLPDPGSDLPPPKGARLGISVEPDITTGGLSVAHIVPHSRADRIGLQIDDVIRQINGKEVTEVKELRNLVTEHAKGLVLDVTRDGREIKLEEK